MCLYFKCKIPHSGLFILCMLRAWPLGRQLSACVLLQGCPRPLLQWVCQGALPAGWLQWFSSLERLYSWNYIEAAVLSRLRKHSLALAHKYTGPSRFPYWCSSWYQIWVSQTSWGCWQLEGPSCWFCLSSSPFVGISRDAWGYERRLTFHLSGLKLEVKPVFSLEWLCWVLFFAAVPDTSTYQLWWIFRILLWSNNRAVLWPQLTGNLRGKTDVLRCNVLTEKFMKLTRAVLAVLLNVCLHIYTFVHLPAPR